MANSKRNKWNL